MSLVLAILATGHRSSWE